MFITKMIKSYFELLDDISEEELFEGLLGYGMFSEKLPPIFSSVPLYQFYNKKTDYLNSVEGCENGYINFDSMRNTSIPRTLGIPHPIKYAILCKELAKNWKEIKKVFSENTLGDNHKISRIHIRKFPDKKSLFEMDYDKEEPLSPEDNELSIIDDIPNVTQCERIHSIFSLNYKNCKEDGDPLLDFSIGKRYVVKTDISQCFSSIYTHAIPWAIVGKDEAKSERTKGWHNRIDWFCRNMRNGETHGLMIGPHASNLLSEIILTSVDKELKKNYEYIRHIDDYICYVDTYANAEAFLRDLNIELRKFDLLLNNRKTVISELPQIRTGSWVLKLNDERNLWASKEMISLNTVRLYLDKAVELVKENGDNASILFYAMKVLCHRKLSDKAADFCVKEMCHLAIIYPYLVPIMDQYVFSPCNASDDIIQKFAEALYKDSERVVNFEAISYALFFAYKYRFELVSLKKEYIIESPSCICRLLLFYYCQSLEDSKTLDLLKDKAIELMKSDFDENWIFIYEILSLEDFTKEMNNIIKNLETSKDKVDKKINVFKEWLRLKKAGISFVDFSICSN